MVHIEVKEGLDIPIDGHAKAEWKSLAKPKRVALNLNPFANIRFKLHAKVGDTVKIGQVIAEDKGCPGRMFVSPGHGKIIEIRRGLKRRILDVIIELCASEDFFEHQVVNISSATYEEIIASLMAGGLFSHIRQRPFNILADPHSKPEHIFIKALESEPYAPPAEWQVEGHESLFQKGLDFLEKLCPNNVHLTFHKETSCKAFIDAHNVNKHTVCGPHPAGNTSVHIHHIAPISKANQCYWTLNIFDVLALAELLQHGKYFTERVVSLAGAGIQEKARAFYKVRAGMPIHSFIDGNNTKGELRFISGSLLTGSQVQAEDFLGFYDHTVCALEEATNREFLHFFKPGLKKYSMHGVYASGHNKNADKEYHFTTSKHGEERAFIDGTIYEKVMPMGIPTMHLVKAVIGGDFETAEELGLLEVASEDFALATFICPCKIEMVDIMKEGIQAYAKEMLG